MLEGFERSRFADPAAEGRCRATAPPPAGHPQTHVMWHAPMPALSRRFTVVAADPRIRAELPGALRVEAGYGGRLLATTREL